LSINLIIFQLKSLLSSGLI